MNIQDRIEKHNKERADALYARERAKTDSEKYLDYFKKYSADIEMGIKKLNSCIQNYKNRGNDYVNQVPLITPHIGMLKSYAEALEAFAANLTDNIAVEKDGTKIHGILKIRNQNDVEVLFNGLDEELKFVESIAKGAFDVITNYGDAIRRIVNSKQR